VIRSIKYDRAEIRYEKFEAESEELFKLGRSTAIGIHGATMSWDAAGHVLHVIAHSRIVTMALAP
jgi:hypothetical protein